MQKIYMIMGVQRSGTTALFETLSTAPGMTAYNESPDNELFLDYDLRPEPEIRSLLGSVPHGVLLKPVNESKRRTVAKVCEEYRDYEIRVIWLYRDPVNVLSSWEREGWTQADYIGSHAHQWAMRNQGMLEVLPDYRDRVIVVRYEDLLTDAALVHTLAAQLNLTVTSTLRPDSNAGRKKMPQHLQALADHITGATLTLLDAARTLTPEAGQALPAALSAAKESPLESGRRFPWLRLFGTPGNSPPEKAPAPRHATSATPTIKSAVDQPDPYSLAFLRDPHSCFRQWRQGGDIHLLADQQTWLLLSYDDVCAVLADDAGFATTFSADLQRSQDNHERLLTVEALKRLNPFLTPARTQAQSGELEAQMHDALLECCRQPEFDWVKTSWQLFPRLGLIWLGVKPECVTAFKAGLSGGIDPDVLRPNLSDDGLLQDLLAEGGWTPADLGRVIASVENLVSCVLAPALSGALYQIFQHPDWRASGRQQPEQIPMLVAELLRLMPPCLTVTRRVVSPTEIGGRKLAAGNRVMLCVGAANRDPGKFEAADELRLHRPPPPPIQYAGFDTSSIILPLAPLMGNTLLKLVLTQFDSLALVSFTEEDRFLFVHEACLFYSPISMMLTSRYRGKI